MDNKINEQIVLYALGELEPEENASVEAQIKADPALQEQVDKIRKTDGLLSDCFAAEPIPEPAAAKPVVERKNVNWSITALVSAIACTSLVVITGLLIASAYLGYPFTANRIARLSDNKDVNICETASARISDIGALDGETEIIPQESAADGAVYKSESDAKERSARSNANYAAPAQKMKRVRTAVQPEGAAYSIQPNIEFNEHAISSEKALELPDESAAEPVPVMMAAPVMRAVPAADAVPAMETAPSEDTDQDNSQINLDGSSVNELSGYAPKLEENKFTRPQDENFSTFGVDVDTASYTIMRQNMLSYNSLPVPASVRVEEYINYFDYHLTGPAFEDKCPIAADCEVGNHPWEPGLLLAKIGIKAKNIERKDVKPLNLVFLLDVSGSMDYGNKLPLVKDSMLRLLDELRSEDSVSIVTYSGSAQVVLPPTAGNKKREIEQVILNLSASGSTAGADGIDLAYQIAKENFNKDSINRVILCSDGDFNVGMTDISALGDKISTAAQSGVFLTVLGFGMGNMKDNLMETLADKGNGNYAYIDSRAEAYYALSEGLIGTVVTVAKDVKVQVDFNPATVKAYRLIGYENRKLEANQFNNDKIDSGDMGAGHSMIALYEIVPIGVDIPLAGLVDKSRYAPEEPSAEDSKKTETPQQTELKNELFLVKIRYKLPDSDTSEYKDFPVSIPNEKQLEQLQQSKDFRFAAAVALYAQLLKKSSYTESASISLVKELLEGTIGDDAKRTEFKTLVDRVPLK